MQGKARRAIGVAVVAVRAKVRVQAEVGWTVGDETSAWTERDRPDRVQRAWLATG